MACRPVARTPVARRPVRPKDRNYVKSITHKALARVDVTAKYSHSGEMLSWGLWVSVVAPTLHCVDSRVIQKVVLSQPEYGIWSKKATLAQ